ncbi:hypothetical protein G9F71_026180 [Clostridium sp. FP2]|uniref:hypothetical protein n=1 Tax=Clostridium sp. FP2 TaxID=2724481 RepID=UPI001CCB1F87|nr:hypothetical protein [Clostridium sp. FP2]MBZ9626297.1 hypothetical protein [Clostridium sp. FP2]
MDKYQFVINILDLYWTHGENDEEDNPEDLCLHGDVYVRIGEEIVADNYSCTVSSTGLYLLKSLKENHVLGESQNQMLPCCGFFIIPNDVDDTVEISGCPTGVDWSVLHTNDYVKLITEKGNEVDIELNSYREIVFSFVDKIEDFYRKCQEKNIPQKHIPTNDFEYNGYIKFWREWSNRKNKQNYK